MQKQNPLLRIWGWGKDEHGRLIGAVISALIAVLLGMLPYFAAAQVIIGMLAWEKDLSFYLRWSSFFVTLTRKSFDIHHTCILFSNGVIYPFDECGRI